jgi:hypothetical protein
MKRCLLILLTGAFTALLFASCVPLQREGGQIQMFGYGYDQVVPPVVSVQNENLRLDFLTDTAQIVLTELSTGNEWLSTPRLSGEDRERTAAITLFQMQSMFILYHEDRHGRNVPYDAYRYSVRTNRFEHEIINSTTMELRFTVGDVPETFHIPYAIYAERLYTFTETMSRSDLMLIMNSYRRLEYARLRPADIEDGILEQFPMLRPEEGEEAPSIYVLVDNIAPQVRERIQGILYNHGYTHDDWVSDMAYFGVDTGESLAVFNVVMQLELTGNEMVVTVPLERITYNPDFLPVRLVVLPFFGAGHEMDEGYIFVPDGSGAIIHFDSTRHNQGIYFSNVFGWDEAVLRSELVHDNRSPFPVFGIYRNGAAFAGIIEEGASYAAVRAEVAGMGAPFGRVHPSFRLIHGAMLDVGGRSREEILMHEHDLNRDEQIVIRYVLTETPGYVGMAVAYRQFLQERFPWLNNRVEQPVTAMVEILGAALTNQHFLGFPVERPFPLTTYEQAADMMNAFNDFGWQNVHIKMRGAHNDSIDHSIPNRVRLISQLGNRSSFENMLDTASGHGFHFYIEGDFMFMRNPRLFDGFRRNRDVVRQVTRQRLEHNGFAHTFFGPMERSWATADPVQLAAPSVTERLARNFVEDAASRGVNNIAFRSMANALAGDFNEDAYVSREASMNMRMELLSELRESGTGIWLNYGLSFGIPFADIVTSMPVSDQAFNVTDVSVPFYQIALHGLIPFAGRPINLAEDYSYHLLRSVESGASLFFSFMDVPAADLNVSRYRRYFANEFARWANIANDFYQRHASDFGHLYNQLIIDHQILGQGVSVTVYEDNTRVYVNTSAADFITETGVEIAARRYVVRRG